MAMIDYGAIAFKNGKLISTGMFTPMIDMVGWEDTSKDMYESRPHFEGEPEGDYMKPLRLKGNFFAYIGDKDCTLAFYKTGLALVYKYSDNTFEYQYEWFNSTKYTWTKWEDWVFIGGECYEIKVTKRNGYYVCKWKYKGDKYKVYFGYGVDFDYYKKYCIVNYYRSPAFRMQKLKRYIKDIPYNIKTQIYLYQRKKDVRK